ncbi:MAG: helix-turn-helix transcriptional regulator [Eubacterium sp.]|nr:helix-turn-helix transcriptional regulator [Eubacterium sp.]
MLLAYYENRSEGISVEWKKTVHVPPHLHEAIEIVYVTEGTIALGVGQELYHMDTGDFAIVFPNVIHHYQAFGIGKNKTVYLYVEPSLLPSYYAELQKYSPAYPIIKKENVHTEIVNALKALVHTGENSPMLVQAYAQMILAHVFSEMPMIDKKSIGSDDLIYNAVEYVAKNFQNEITLEKMAYELGVSKYVLSRMFAKTFHCNFKKYVNGIRLNYASTILENSQDSITNICLDCGFESQRTFNRVFKERYKMTPREYRKRKLFIGNGKETEGDIGD